MSPLGKRVHLVPTSLEYDRLEKALQDYAADRVYILRNKDPVDSHKELNKNLTEKVRDIVKENTRCFEKDEIIEESVDFYRFRDALVEIYKIIFREKTNGNEVIINLSGGTRPVAIASFFACSFAGSGEPVYYIAEEYEFDQEATDGIAERGISHGVVELPVITPHAEPLNLEHKIPNDVEKIEIITSLLDSNPDSMKNILVNIGKIEKKVQQETKEERQKIIQKYHRHGGKLAREDIVKKQDSEYALTDTGELIGRLLKAQAKVKSENEYNNSDSPVFN